MIIRKPGLRSPITLPRRTNTHVLVPLDDPRRHESVGDEQHAQDDHGRKQCRHDSAPWLSSILS
jgi:hypothetical protein